MTGLSGYQIIYIYIGSSRLLACYCFAPHVGTQSRTGHTCSKPVVSSVQASLSDCTQCVYFSVKWQLIMPPWNGSSHLWQLNVWLLYNSDQWHLACYVQNLVLSPTQERPTVMRFVIESSFDTLWPHIGHQLYLAWYRVYIVFHGLVITTVPVTVYRSLIITTVLTTVYRPLTILQC